MEYYSTGKKAPNASLRKAVLRGLAEDRGLYMPEHIPTLPASFFRDLPDLSCDGEKRGGGFLRG